MLDLIKKPTLILSLVGIIFSIYLIIIDLTISEYCPKIMLIPACYIAIIAYLLIFCSQLVKPNYNFKFLFYCGFIIGFLLAIWFSYNQILLLENCPKIIGIPMCYLSLILLILILLTNFYDNK